MKPMLTTIFAIALMVFVFDANPAMAQRDDTERNRCVHAGNTWTKEGVCKITSWWDLFAFEDEDENSDQEGNERDIADSGEEGSTSAAGATEQ
ncbi:MAG: hypothetical protein OXF09_04880 [Hyphomicrobiales bacterium]|nr:hypothetical protein [Hyphomicrobiales bacterium]